MMSLDNTKKPSHTSNNSNEPSKTKSFSGASSSSSERYMDRDSNSISYQVYPGVERNVYDFTAERHYLHATNLFESTSHLIKGCLGVGVMTIHVGFMYAGLWTAVVANIINGLLMCNSMLMLVRSAHRLYIRLRIPKLTYPDLMETAVGFGPWSRFRKYNKAMRYIVEMFLLIKMCGVCCIYQIIMAKTIKALMEHFYQINFDKRIWILIVAGPLVLICLIRSLKYLAPFSIVADVIIALCVLTTIYYSINKQVNIKDRPAWKSIQGLFRFQGISLYSVDGIAITMPVENTMKNPKYFHIVLQYGMSVVITCTTLTGFFGYWGWGEECKSPITSHMPGEVFPSILQFLFMLVLTVTFAVNLWVPFKVLWFYLRLLHERKKSIWERFYRALLVLCITCGSIAFPSMNNLIIFYGNFCLSFLAFVFPAIIEMCVEWRNAKRIKRSWVLIKDVVLIILGLVLAADLAFALNFK